MPKIRYECRLCGNERKPRHLWTFMHSKFGLMIQCAYGCPTAKKDRQKVA